MSEKSKRVIYCCGCETDVPARLTDGLEIYPQRREFAKIPFWRCDACGNYVGCHHKSSTPIEPLGCIPTPELKKARQHIHAILDPIWKSGSMHRVHLYAAISAEFGRAYHTAEIRTIEEARLAYRIISKIAKKVEDDF